MTGGGHEKAALDAEASAERRLEEWLNTPLFRREKEVPPEAFLWLALAPGWTLPLAEACHFPTLRLDVKGTLERLRALGVVHATRVLLSDEESADLYQMGGEGRTSVLEEMLGDRKEWRSLQVQLAKIGRLLTAMPESMPEVLPETRRWAGLAQYAEDPSRLADVFEAKVKEALSGGDTASALRWMETARPLTDLLASCLEMGPKLALERAARWLDLHRQRRHDEQLIRFYLKRPEQEKAFEDLRDDRGEAWALHFLGAGGVGKTTFIRHIAVELAKQPDEMIVARVDFDYLNPDYPRLAPGLLLSHFAAELCSYDRTGRATECVRQADDILRDLYGKLRFTGPRAAGRSTDRPEFRTALGHYLDAFRELRRPILLIVDTCEELLKFRPEDGVLESLEETFRVLRALHDGPDTLSDPNAPPSGGLPTLRVIFSGRRLLASAGYKWQSEATGDGDHLRLPARPYLRLHEVRGFSHQEARAYLRETLGVPEELVEPIIEKSSPDVEATAPVVYEEGTARPDRNDRCHPMELRLFADWAKETPPPTPETLREASSVQYVERRILQRLPEGPLPRLMPVLSLMGHFHAGIIRDIAAALELDFDSLYEELLGQEWADQMVQPIDGGARSRLGLTIEPGLLRRLRAYYDDRSIGGDVLESAAAALERTTLHDGLESLDWLTFDAALRVLERDPSRAATWWQQVEARLLAERDFAWIASWTQTWTGPDGAAAMRGARESPVRPAALAFHAAVLLHCDPRANLAALWQEVAERAEAYPLPALRAPLRLRAVAGVVAGARHLDADPDPGEVAPLWEEIEALGSGRCDLQQIASLVAAVEALVERAEWPPEEERSRALLGLPASQGAVDGAGPDPGADKIETRARRLWEAAEGAAETAGKQQLCCFIASLAARMHLLAGRPDLAQTWFSRSLEDAPATSESSSPVWLDWIPPDDVAARVRLEFVRACCPGLLSPEETLAAVGDWRGRADTVDGERLHSTLLRLRLASGTVTEVPGWPSAKEGSAPPPAQLVPGESACIAHREAPPLFATYAEVLAASGRVEAALAPLRRVLSQSNLFPFEACLWAERALLRIACRMRLGEEGLGAGGGLAQSPDLADHRLLWTAQALGSRSDDALDSAAFVEAAGSPESAARLNALWQTLCVRSSSAPQALIRKAAACFPTERAGPEFWTSVSEFDFASLRLDLWEASLAVAGAADSSVPTVQLLVKPDLYWEQHPRQPEEAFRLWLRVRAISRESGGPPAPPSLLTRLGQRRAAEIALEEADLLALRLPRAAVRLYDLAGEWFPETDAGRLVSMVAAMVAIEDQEAIGDRLGATAAAYEAFRASAGAAALPAWQELEALADSPVLERWEALGPIEWRPWLVRLLLCLARRPGRHARAAGAFDTLAAWAAGRYPHTLEGAATCPPDLVPWVKGRAPAPSREDLRDPLARRAWRARALWAGALAFAGVGTALPFRRMSRVEPTPWVVVVGLAWFVACSGLTILFVRSRLWLRWLLLPAVLTIVLFESALVMGSVMFRDQSAVTSIKGVFVAIAAGTVCYFLWNVVLMVRAGWASLSTLEPQASPAPSDEDLRDPSAGQAWRARALWVGALAFATWIMVLFVRYMVEPARTVNSSGELHLQLVAAWVAWVVAGLGLTIRFVTSRLWLRWLLLPSVILMVVGDAGGVVTVSVRQLIDLTSAIGVCVAIGTAIAAGTVCYFLWNVVLMVRAGWAGLFTLELRTSQAPPASAPGGQAVRLRLAHRWWSPALQWPPWARRQELLEQDSPSPKPAAYSDFASLLPDAAQDVVRELRRTLGSRPAEVVIETAPGSHGPAWEAAFAPPVTRDPLNPASLPFRFRRVTTGRPPRQPAAADKVQVAVWATHPVAAQVAAYGWRPISEHAHFALAPLAGNDLEALAPSLAGAHVLHLIGTVEEASQGLRFHSMEATAYRPAGRRAFGPVEVAATDGESAAVRLLRAEDVARLVPNLSLCVLQGPPGHSGTSRLDSDRRAASLARSFAAELFAQGVPAVLVIPSLEAKLAARATAHLSHSLRSRPRRGTRALLEVTALLRRAIAEEAARAMRATIGTPRYLLLRLLDSSGFSSLLGESRRARAGAEAYAPTWETALDICLYAVPDWDGRIVRERGQAAEARAQQAALPN